MGSTLSVPLKMLKDGILHPYMKAMPLLILIRHGQSIWNAANLFTGWENVELSEKGILEAKKAGNQLSEINFDLVFTSDLIRAQKTAEIILEENTKSENVNTIKDFRLNERHYGDLQGMNKDDARKEFGEEQVHIWRRSYDMPPPNGESLKMTAERTLPYFDEMIIPELKEGKNILIAAHGNSLRSIVMKLEEIDEESIVKLEIPTGVPRIYSFENDMFILQK
ncbi:MAG: 2,3-bisphosphoglycerate-dependent phosphoglycerate mutase [Methanobacteriota archaeon]|nr:MAG: 2,3-bisphosphoglycerate-dependent phosphoglycerate mutase [Euryarchaeota archaeon]